MGEEPENAEAIVKTRVLPNFLMVRHVENEDCYCPSWYADTVTASGETPWLVERTPRTTAFAVGSKLARYARDLYRQYFNSAAGGVSWQSAVLQ